MKFRKFAVTAVLLCNLTLLTAQEQNKFTHISLVTFRSNLEYVQGKNTQTYNTTRRLAPFSINKYETTYYLWYTVRTKAEALGYYFQNPGQPGSNGKRACQPDEENSFQPVTAISWYDAVVWCNALSELRGRTPCYTYNDEVLRDSGDTAALDLAECNWECDGYRLPSEAEWEYAARKTKTGMISDALVSGQTTRNGDDPLLFAWSSDNTGCTQVIGTAGIPFDPNAISKPATGNANGAGLYDMSGNALEFCWDWFGDYDEKLPYGPAMGFERVSRGGSISEYTPFLFSGDRYSFDPNEYYNYTGFRLAASAQ